ncbi:hypothetical protein ACP70R_049334 [Stipagrostis hirtigluma subsp. patula]
MAVAPYTLRPSPPPPRHDAPLLPHVRPQPRRRAAARVAASWAPAGGDADDGVGGWSLPEQAAEQGNRAGFGRALAVGLGASTAIALGGLTWYSPSSRKCLQQLIVTPLQYVQDKLSNLESEEISMEDVSDREPDENVVSNKAADEKAESMTDESRQNHGTAGGSHVSFRVPIDPIHEEAISILKKLQIIEEDVSSSDFCTRREFARWFVKLCSKFERKRMQRITPNKLTSGTVQSAFDDVNIDDPDFLYIQYYLSRFDLVNWKVLVEHPCALEIDQKMLSQSVRILDLSACPDVSSSMLIELMTGENSIVSRVFGNTRRLQPHKPVTKAQAAAALTSGRMEEVIRDELNRLEAENEARLSAIAEIMEELIGRGDIKQYWEEKMKKEQERALEVDKDLQHILHELGDERGDREKELANLLKERAALGHQSQELISLRSEIDGMYDRLATESAEVIADQQTLESLLSDMSSKLEAVNKSKSNLEAEKEALTMLRSLGSNRKQRVSMSELRYLRRL